MMGGNSRTLVLVGRTGNGKSATGNSILGKKEFLSKASSGGVTGTSELRTTELEDGQVVNVIDTPGLFDSSVDAEFIGKEIVKSIGMAREGIHAILLVISVRNRYTEEEKAVLSSLRSLFGNEISNYMIVVFTGGDEFEEEGQTLEGFLRECSWTSLSLQETLSLCGGRYVLFDNMTKDQSKKAFQVHNLLTVVNMMLTENNGEPYIDKTFSGLKKLHEDTEVQFLQEQMKKSYEEKRKQIAEMIDSRTKEVTSRLELQLAEEHKARMKAEEMANAEQLKSEDEIDKLKEKIAKAQKLKDWIKLIFFILSFFKHKSINQEP